MKKFAKIVATLLVICMLFSSFVFADAEKPVQSASIVSPTENSIVANDNLLVSVKVLDKKKVQVTVFEEKLQKTDATGKVLLDKDNKEILLSVDVKEIKPEDFEDITKLYQDQKFVDVVVGEPAVFTAVGEVGYFTKTIENLSSGLYRIQVEVLDKDGEVTESYGNFVALQEKPVVETETKTEKKNLTVETQKASIVQAVVNFFKTIIK